ncbi:MAG: hypothetical protein ABS36_03625 [Acidobacteria bacterium SCN 69-37]|nr:MAG: hypothetical protein ABS36_03625 [Acidobacteria bacterium SCN 69-37]
MGFLDKLMPQPRWKHADPAVRLDAVKDVDDLQDLAQLAEHDPDVRVRRAAAARVDDVAVLGRIAGADPDEDARDKAADRLVALASRQAMAGEDPAGPEAQIALEAVRAIADVRRLSTLAKGQAADAVREHALARITDERALGSIARHAKSEGTAAAALARLGDRAEFLEVAMHGDHKDIALAAFDRLSPETLDLNDLRSIEVRAHQKAVSRRARTMIQDIEAAEAARQTAALERQRRESMLCDAMEQLASVADVSVLRGELVRLTDAWQALDVTETTARDRFARATTAVEAAIHRRDHEADEAADRLRLRAEAIATRIALCERVETLEGDDVLEQLVPIEEEWRALLPLVGNGPEADRLAERFAQTVAACRKRHEMGAQLQDARTTLEARVVEAEGLVSHDDAAAAEQRWVSLSREARGLVTLLERAARPADDLIERLRGVDQVFVGRQTERETAAEAAREAAATLLRRLIDRARRVADAETMTLREGDRLMRDIAAGLETATRAGSSKTLDDTASELRELQGKVAPRVRELREMDDWRRFANAQRQEQLITMAEAIVASLRTDEEAGKETDLAATARALRELHAEWQQVAEAPRQSAQRLWDRFRTATDLIRSRCEPFFIKRREERSAAHTHRLALVEEAEALVSSNDWAKAAARFQAMQTEWQALGGPAGDGDRQLFQRFRAAANAFFARRREDLADRKKIWAENLERKEALCARAEELASSTEWDTAVNEMKRLQADWKTIGPVRKNKSDAIWARFRTAADTFFERYHNRHEVALAAKLAEREAIVIELETLAALPAADLPASAAEDVQRLRGQWNRSVPVPLPGMKTLTDRWQHALGQLVSARADLFTGTDLDPQSVVQRMQKLVARVEALASEAPKATDERRLSPTELMAAKLRQALASNAMGSRHHDEARQRATVDAVRDAQAAWQRLPPVALPEARELESRFRDACRKLQGHDRSGRSAHPHKSHRPAPAPAAPAPEHDAEPATV